MDFEKTFKHTDGRLFSHLGETPHRTRDGRDIKLQVWDVRCLNPECDDHLRILTATNTPQTWPNFEPRKYCKKHLSLARKSAIKARQQGLVDWLASPEGEESLRNRKGKIEACVIGMLEEHSLLGEGVPASAAFKKAEGELAAPPVGKRDTRHMRVMRSLDSLIRKDRIHVINNILHLGPRPKLKR